MATKIRHKRSAVAGRQPIVSQLESGELAINTADGKVYLLRDDNSVQDITKRIFEGDTEVKVDDLGAENVATITATVNNTDKMILTNDGINIKDDVDLENAATLTFRELTASGDDGIGLKSPDTLDNGYTLTLPPSQGTNGQIIAIDGTGNLFFQDADIFGGNVIYVSEEQGDDANDGQAAPVRTIKRACKLASAIIYAADGTLTGKRVNVKVAVGDYTEDNPVIIPDNVVVKGDGLRGCIVRPANANLDMFRVRNACYFGEFTFRDGIDVNGIPTITWDYATVFDNPDAPDVTDRSEYTNLPNTKPTITTSPYTQNASIISFLGGSGAKIDGALVQSPNVPRFDIEAENPVAGAIPEQGKSMVANAYTMLSFGGTGWRLLNDAYAQIVSCFQIFLLNGVYTQSGGYCSITNSATNFGLYALRSSGYSPKAFEFDRGFVTSTGESEGKQTITTVGVNREAPVEEFVLRFRDPGYKYAHDILLTEKTNIANDTVTWIDAQISAASPSIWAGFTYDQSKCQRDTQLLLEAIKYDMIFNSNYRSISSALKYYNGTFPNFADQRDQHVDAFTQAKAYTSNYLTNQENGGDTTLINRANALWDEIIDILTNGEGNADAYSFPTPTGGSNNASDSGYANAVQQLIANKLFIQKEVTAWIDVQVVAQNTPFVSTFTYNSAACEEDIGFIIDALVYDLTYGGNLQTYDAALQYFVGTQAQFADGQKEETIAAYGRLKTIIGEVILETAVSVSAGNAQTQDTSGTPGSTDAQEAAEDRIQEIVDYIDSDGATPPTKIYPDISWTTTTEQNHFAILDEEGAKNVAQGVIAYIESSIQAAIWYNFTYDSTKCRRDTQLIVEAVAKDTWDKGNRYSRSAGLSYFNQNLQDSSEISISGQELQTDAAIRQAATYAIATITGAPGITSAIEDFVNTRFNIVADAITDPLDIPTATDVSSEGDISNDYKTNPTETTFDAASDINVASNIITITSHGFTNGEKVIYDNNGNLNVGGLDQEQTYYVKLLNENEFTLTFDDSLEFDVDIFSLSTGTHKFLSGVIEFFIEEITSVHTTYQTLILESGAESYEFIPGRAITGTTGTSNNSAIVYSWEPLERRLRVSIEEVAVGSSNLRIQFDATSTITQDHASSPNSSIGVNDVAALTGYNTATFTITATDGSSSLTNLVNLPEQEIWLHRPSIVNSSAHTWEYAGSGTDYNALPQNGGNTREEFEQYEELPGRVYSSGTNELGDFKVGDFITAFNRTGNITFRNKVQVDELDALRLSLSDVAIEEISTDVNLGDDEIGGSSNARLSTQLAVRSFISNRLGGFVDKSVSTAAVPGAIVQLNVNGQLNPDLIPATRQFTNTNTNGYLSRLEQVDDIPATDLKAGDIATENYEQVELTLSGTINANDGDTITQTGVVGAIGYAKGNFSTSGNILVATIGEAWDDTDDSTGDPWEVSAGNLLVNGVDSGVNVSSKGASTEITDNFFLKSSNTSQYLNLDTGDDYTFTSATITAVERNSNIATASTSGAHNLQIGNDVQVKITDDETYNENTKVLSVPSTTTFTYANSDAADPTKASAAVSGTARTIVTSADGSAQGAVTEVRYGIVVNVDNANITGGSLYTPTDGTETYSDVDITGGTGSGAKANITITAGAVTDVDITRGGTGYTVGDILSVSAANVGGTGSGFSIEATVIEKRAYVDILGGELFVASASSIDFVEDNTAIQNAVDINLDDIITNNFLAGTTAGGGNVNYTDSRIEIANHGYGNGDPVTYNTLGNVAIGGLLNGSVYYVKVISSGIIELYEDFSLLNQVEFLSTPANNNHNITRYTINLTDNSVVVESHGFTTGDAIRVESLSDGSTTNSLPTVGGDAIVSGSRFFVGSVTTNSFTLHSLRSDALSSINGLVTNAQDIDGTGVGSAQVIQNNVQVNAVVNTSSRLKANWNTLAATNIDAENIISGTISPSRLGASGTPNSDTFLRGDSAYSVVVQKLKKANTTDNPIVLTGSSISGEFYGDPVNIGIVNADYDPLGTFSTLGTSRFLQTQFDVNSNGSGEVFIKDGVVDAGTLDSLDSAYFLNPANLTSLVPVNKGGTNISTYAVGDILYAQSAASLNTLAIGQADTFLKSNGTTPEWGTALDLAEGLDVGSAKLSSSSDGIGQVYNDNVTALELGGDAENVKIGKNSTGRSIASFVNTYEANITQDVVVNLNSVNISTNAVANNTEKSLTFSDTSNIKFGMIVTGSGSIPSNTTVSGVTETGVFLSNALTGSVLSGTAITFTYTPLTLGIRAGDIITISGSTITNLDGTWPVSGATENATSFTVRTDANVTSASLTQVGTIVKENSLLLRNNNISLGSAVTSSAPSDAVIRGEAGIGNNIGGGEVSIQGGTGTGNATGGDVVIKTGEVGASGDIPQTQTTRLTIDTSGKAAFTGEVEVNNTISTTEATVGLLDDTATTINFGGDATTVDIGAATGTTTVRNNLDVDGDFGVKGDVLSTDVTGTFNLINTNATTVNIGGAATTINMGTGGDGGGTTTIGHDLVVTGDLTVNGDTTTINSTTLTVDDKNIVVASGAADANAANGAGLTIDGAGVTFQYDSLTDRMDLNEDLNITSGNSYFINDANVLSSTTLGAGVVSSSLTTVGTISTGTWQGSIISPTYGGTGVNNGSKTITLGGNFTHSGAHTLTLATTGNTSLFLPTSGTLAIIGNPLSQFASTTSAQLAGVLSDETGTGVAVFGTSPNFTTSVTTGSTTFSAFNTNATTVNAFGAATSLTMGATSGTTTIRNSLDVDGDINIDGGDLTFSDATVNIANTTPTTINFGGAGTGITIGAATGTTTIRNATTTLDGNLNVNGTTIDTDETGTFNLIKDNVTTLAFGQAATSIVMAATTGTTQIRNNVDIDGNLNVDGVLTIDAIDDVPIGQTTPAAGGFTTLSANNFVTFTDATNTAGSGTFAADTASVKMTGGLRVAKDIFADNLKGDLDAAYITSGTIPDARIQASGVTQHQASITGTGALNSGSITSGFGNINIGTSIFSGDGSGITNINANQVKSISSSVVEDAAISASSVTQHQGSITGTGALNDGSITSGFGNIDIGTSTFTGNGSGLTTLNASNLSSGTVDGARLGGNQSMGGVKTFTNTTASTSTTTGAVKINGGLGVQGAVYSGGFNGAGSGITNLNASNLASGTVPNARVSGTYSNLTGTGALDTGEITTTFGNINIGTSTFTGNGSGLTNVDAETLDGIDSANFLRSDQSDTMTGSLTLQAANPALRFNGTSDSGVDMEIYATPEGLDFREPEQSDRLQFRIGDDTGCYAPFGMSVGISGSGTYGVWHSGNDGPGSTLDADTVDGQQASEMSWGHDFPHGTYTNFNTFNNTALFGAHYVQGTANGPGLNGATQYYHARYSLGSQYNNYGAQMAFGRNVTNPYIAIRYEENGSFGSWQKISAGNADNATNATNATNANFATNAGQLDGLDSTDFQKINGTSVSMNTATNTAAGWYTIAVNSGNRAEARFAIKDVQSSRHQSVVFYANHHFGNSSGITVLSYGRYSGTPIRYIRIKEGGTYDGAMLQVYLDEGTNNVTAYLLGDNFHDSGWIAKDWVADGTNPGNLGNYSALNNTAAQVDLDQIDPAGGMMTSGRLYATSDIRTAGEVTAYYSDERLKDFHGKVDGALDIVNKLNGYRFTENETARELGYKNERMQIGVSAQEVEAVLPELIDKAPVPGDNDYKTVKYDKLGAVLVEALKEADAKIEAQAKQIDELKDLVSKLIEKKE
jgi:hypothetical protein